VSLSPPSLGGHCLNSAIKVPVCACSIRLLAIVRGHLVLVASPPRRPALKELPTQQHGQRGRGAPMAPVGPPVRIRGLLGVVSTLLLGSGHTPGHPVPRVTSAWTTDRRGVG
jgi:hypothetical protein